MLQKASNVECTVTTDDMGEPPAKINRLLGEDKDIGEDDKAVSTLEELKIYFQECPIKQKKIHFIGGESFSILCCFGTKVSKHTVVCQQPRKQKKMCDTQVCYLLIP